MALQFSSFKTRSLTAIVFAMVMLVGMLWNKWSFLVLLTIIHFGCWWEYLQLSKKIFTTKFQAYTQLGLMVMGYGIMLCFCRSVFQINGYGLKDNFSLPVSAAGFAILIVGIFQQKQIQLKAFGMALLGLIYISVSLGFFIHLYGLYATDNTSLFSWQVVFLPLFIIACMWINDTMAYLVGSLIGKTPLTKISPKKTWEGTLGGMICAACIVGYAAYYFDEHEILQKSFFNWVVLSFVAALAGVWGDLFQSKLKRMAGVKDSGQFLPGHGGFLDRFDSLLLATPVVWIFLQFLH